ncbi:MAG: hypothetical protein ACLS43_09390 [Evtepia gabavorous]
MNCAGHLATGRTGPRLEGQIVRVADKIAYINHDIDDAMRGGSFILWTSPDISQVLRFVRQADQHADGRCDSGQPGKREIVQSPPADRPWPGCAFMFEAVYHNPLARGGGVKAQDMIARLFEFYTKPDDLPPDYQDIRAREGRRRSVTTLPA